MRRYLLHWLDGQIETITGLGFMEAWRSAGYHTTTLDRLDWYEELSMCPDRRFVS